MIHKRTLTQNRRNQFTLFALVLSILLSLACITLTISTEVTRTNDGKNLIGMQVRWEIDPEAFRALQDYDSSMIISRSCKPAAGIRCVVSDGGRVTEATLDPALVEALNGKGWIVTEQKIGNGRLVTARLDTSAASGENFSIVIDERDPSAIHYSFDATFQVKPDSGESVIPRPDPQKEPERYQKWQRLDRAIKAAGPGKMIFSVTLPGIIERTNGSVRGNQTSWTISSDKYGSHNMQASSFVKPGAASPPPTVASNPIPPIAAIGARGDCDSDGKITELDALCALEMSVKLRPVQMNMDMDNNGNVDSRDAVLILQRAIGK